MDVSHILDPLNDAQREAVAAPDSHTLVLAGAGSGKTRVLVHRVAWVIATENLSPYSVLAVTFTNKAAGEMRSRIESLMNIPAGGMWVGTFHGIAHRLLRAHYEEAGLPKSFQVLDSDDQQRLIKRVIRQLEIDEEKWPPRHAQWYINGKKDEGIRPQHISHNNDPAEKVLVRIYQAYEDICKQSGLVDFAELLLRAHELWLQRPDVLDHYRNRFRHILVDEFQDTNTIQYAWLRLLAGESASVFIVGDDDQSIYGWRGAKVENIHRFQSDFKDTHVVRLEQNYRSTGTILQAANSLIQNNTDRMGKSLWTSGSEGELIKLYAAFNEQDEARYVVNTILQLHEQGHARKECAVLYRSNAQSRVMEEALIMSGVPYRVYGGLRFFERAEIKDSLAYMRLLDNPLDDAAFERIVNTPPRGIGDRTVQIIRDQAGQSGQPLWRATEQILQAGVLTARAKNAVQAFVDLINDVRGSLQQLDLGEQLDHVIEVSGLQAHYQKEKGEKGRARIENLRELVSAGREFEIDMLAEQEEDSDDESPLSMFLAYTALESGESQAGPGEDYVHLMTLHTAKGLEFPYVFLVGVEEGLFPHERSMEDPSKLEEERRLCYVGMTRAMKLLYICYAEQRRMYGRENYAYPSRFIKEIPAELMEEVRPKAKITVPTSSRLFDQSGDSDDFDGFQIGQIVQHAKFGPGVLLQCEGSGSHARVQVNFESCGSKWLVLAYANLQSM